VAADDLRIRVMDVPHRRRRAIGRDDVLRDVEADIDEPAFIDRPLDIVGVAGVDLDERGDLVGRSAVVTGGRPPVGSGLLDFITAQRELGGRFDPSATPLRNDCYLRAADGRSRRKAVIGDRPAAGRTIGCFAKRGTAARQSLLTGIGTTPSHRSARRTCHARMREVRAHSGGR
jgi:hypothetical protein